MHHIIKHVFDVVQGKAKAGSLRSPKWHALQKSHLEKHPTCAICGGKVKLQVHHIRPFHLHPELELDPKNLITLCEQPGRDHHLNFGHLGSFKSFNVDVASDAIVWNNKIRHRPQGE